MGFPLAWYDAQGLHWLARRARLDLYHAVPYAALLDVTTEVIGFRRIWARRRNTIVDSRGHLLSLITMDWIFTDREGRPTKVVPEMEAAFPGLTNRLEVEHLDVGDAPEGVQSQEYLVRAHQADPRGHMNSAAYVDLFEDALVGAGTDPQERPAVYEIEYLRAAASGDLLHRFVWAERGGWIMVATTPQDIPVAKGRRNMPPPGTLP